MGVECTLNRVQDSFLDQLDFSGHAARGHDLDLLATLGARRIRYPVLWERAAPEHPDRLDWRWTDERLTRLRGLGLDPIATLLHHGSGPRYTSLLDPAFPERLAAYAAQVAARYPWVRAYTPVNEPLTTARFSGLYGIWYPHHASDHSFVRMLLNECRGTVLAMEAIRRIRPDAELIQTDDLGFAHATPGMQPEADFQNERRWLAFDLLCGRVDAAHPLWTYLRRSGAAEEELAWFRAHPCPPSIIGLDYYVTSERFLDERRELYLPQHHNATHADVEAVRVCRELSGPERLLMQTWERYGLPMAVTEAHLGSTREEQLRWFDWVWQAAERVRASGADLRAVTSWAILGSFDWSSLHTQFRGHYEPGAFDVRAQRPRPTALAGLLRQRAAGQPPTHPTLGTPGFWERPSRFLYPVYPAGGGPQSVGTAPARPLLILGDGPLGQMVARLCHERGLLYRVLPHPAWPAGSCPVASPLDTAPPDVTPLDITPPDTASLEDRWTRRLAQLRDCGAWAVVQTTGYGRIDAAERDHTRFREALALGEWARACAALGVGLLTFSSDQVFGGDGKHLYHEHDPPSPVNAYGRTKHEAEQEVLALHPGALVVRSSALFGSGHRHDVVGQALHALQRGEDITLDNIHRFSPTYLPDLVHTSLDLLIDGESGLWHLVNPGASTWAELVGTLAAAAGLPQHHIRAGAPPLGWVAPRPPSTVLGSQRAQLLPHLEQALDRYLASPVAGLGRQ